MQLLTVHLEHGLPLLAGLDLGRLMAAQARLQAEDPSAIGDILEALGHAGELRTIRRLSAVARASADELLEGERNPAKLAELEGLAALRPYRETFGDALGFFQDWAASFNSAPASSEAE